MAALSTNFLKVGNTDVTREIARDLVSMSNTLSEVCTSIDEILNILNQNWSTSQKDQNMCVQRLTRNEELLKKVSTFTSNFADVMDDYANRLETVSSRTVS